MSSEMSEKEIKRVRSLEQLSKRLINPVVVNVWFEENKESLVRELLQNGKVDPSRLFTLSEAHGYQRSRKITLPEIKNGVIVSEVSQEDHYDAPYLKPKFNLSENVILSGEYENLLDRFSLKKDPRVTPEKVPQIEAFKNILYEQYDRQATEILKLNRLIADELGAFYSMVEEKMISTQKSQYPKDFAVKPPTGWSDLVQQLTAIFNRLHFDIDPNSIELEKNLKRLIQNIDLDQLIAEKTSEQVFLYLRKREPIIFGLRALTRKILPIESILEDIIFNGEIKSQEEIRKREIFRDMPDPAEFAKGVKRKNKDSKTSDEKAIEKAIIVLRIHLVYMEFASLEDEVSGIIRHIREKIPDLDYSDNAIRRWVNKYFLKYEENRENRLKRMYLP